MKINLESLSDKKIIWKLYPVADMFVLICKSCCFMSPNQRMKPVSLYFLDKIDILVDVYMISIILHINSKPYQNRMTIPQEILRHSPKKLNNF